MEKDLEAKKQSAEAPGGWRRDLLDWMQLLSVVLVIIVALFTYVVCIVGVDGTSMYPTLHNNDLMLVRRVAYTPESGDVVVLRKDNSFGDRALVKRVIATEGQRVYIDYDNNTITVDGQTLREDYINREFDLDYGDDPMAIRVDLDPQYINTEFVVPEDCVFVCGDNRNHSSDSRVTELGMVDTHYIIGEVLMVLFPFTHFGAVR